MRRLEMELRVYESGYDSRWRSPIWMKFGIGRLLGRRRMTLQ